MARKYARIIVRGHIISFPRSEQFSESVARSSKKTVSYISSKNKYLSTLVLSSENEGTAAERFTIQNFKNPLGAGCHLYVHGLIIVRNTCGFEDWSIMTLIFPILLWGGDIQSRDLSRSIARDPNIWWTISRNIFSNKNWKTESDCESLAVFSTHGTNQHALLIQPSSSERVFS